MAERGEAPGLVGMGREIADEAMRLVHAEIALLKARLVAAAIRLGVGLGLLLTALLLLVVGGFFTVATLVEGLHPMDSWPLYASLVGLVVAALLVTLATMLPHGVSGVANALAALFGLAWLVFLVWFYVIAIIGDGDEIVRRGWAIAAAAITASGFLAGGGGVVLVWRAWRQLDGTKTNLKEDAAWAKRLTKRSTSES